MSSLLQQHQVTGKKGIQKEEEDRPGASAPIPCKKASAELSNQAKLQNIQDKFPTHSLCLFKIRNNEEVYASSWGEDKPKMEDDAVGVLEAETTWADMVHKLRIAVFS